MLGDITINRIAFGTIKLPSPGAWGYPDNPEEARRILRRAIELGVNYLDTAAYYGPLVSDRLIVEALYPYPPDLTIGTKVGGWRGSDKRWFAEAHPQQLKATIEDNLQRLRLEQLPLVHFRSIEHADVPFLDSLAAMAELQQAGKIRHIGLSNVTLDQLKAAQKIVQIASVQNLFNLIDRRDEDILDVCTQQDILFMPYFPLAMGKLGHGVGLLVTIAQRHQATPAQIALAWLRARSPQMVLIPGTSSVAHLEENIASVNIKLSNEELKELAESPEVAAIPTFRY
jgi:aryl-alcohol dehydrogenase-like predicted oxidoreductase